MNNEMFSKTIHPGVRIGHVHLKVADLERAIGFYRDVLGFEVTQRYGQQAAFLSAGGYHHHIGLNTWESLGGSPPPRSATGLYHLAIVYPTRAELADALRRLMAAGITFLPLGLRYITRIPRRKIPLIVLSGMLAMFIPSYLFSLSQQHLQSSVAGILVAMTPAFAI